MRDVLVWVEVILLIGGALITMIGLFWYKTAQFLRFFEVEVNADRGFKVAMIGFVMLLAGIGLLYLKP